MRIASVLFACVVLALFLRTPAARAEDETARSYAYAVRAFNPSLDQDEALRLARTTIAASDEAHLDARLLVALIAVESRWHTHALSNAGAEGLAQFMPATASGLGVDPSDPLQSIRGAAVHLSALLERYALVDRRRRYLFAIAAYNAGAGAVDRYGGVPPFPETRAYVTRVVGLWRRLCGD